MTKNLKSYTESLEHTLKEIYNMAFFDWDTMPEQGRREFQKQVRLMIEKVFENNPCNPK
jgi:hypothetical protein